jgi:hypothetical protein
VKRAAVTMLFKLHSTRYFSMANISLFVSTKV